MNQMNTDKPVNFLGRLALAFQRSLSLWERPFAAAVLTGLIFIGIQLSSGRPFASSGNAYYNFLADAFLHGQLHLRLLPASTQDLSLYHGQYFLYWGPLPAVLLMPFVALFGVGFSDTLQTVFFGSVNAAVFAMILRCSDQQGITQLSPLRRVFMVLFFVLGTAQTPIIPLGGVWHLGQLVALCFVLLAYLAALALQDEKAFFWTGCALAGVLATRTSAIFAGIFLAWYLLNHHWRLGSVRLVRCSLLGIAPVGAVLLLLLVYNTARFGSPLDFGLNYHLMTEVFRENFAKYGVLNVHYIAANLSSDFIFYPFLSFRPLQVEAMGGSLFLLSPLYLAAITALWQNRKNSTTWFLFLTILVSVIPSLLIMAPGTVSFGPRYLLDAAPPLLLLTAIGVRRWSVPMIVFCVVISVLHYLIGALMMFHSWY